MFEAGVEGLSLDVDGRRLLLGFPGAVVAAPEGGVFVAMERAKQTPIGWLVADGSWAVLHIAPGLSPRLVALAPQEQAAAPNASALGIDQQGRLYVATECVIWRTSAEAPGSATPRVVQKLFERQADLFPIRPQGGCYFTPICHVGFIDKIQDLLNRVGGRLLRFPVPAGTEEGDRSVTQAVADGLASVVTEHRAAVAQFGPVHRLAGARN